MIARFHYHFNLPGAFGSPGQVRGVRPNAKTNRIIKLAQNQEKNKPKYRKKRNEQIANERKTDDDDDDDELR